MAKLEYRLYNEGGPYPALYVYERISEEEISLRFACDYFVKGNRVYEKASGAVEPGLYVIYVTEAVEETALPAGRSRSYHSGISVELREYRENTAIYQVIHVFTFDEEETALLYLSADFLTVQGVEWKKTSAEIDEDRGVYVIYVVRSTE